MSANIPHVPTGDVAFIGIPDSMDIPRLVYAAPYFQQVPLAELIEPAVIEATNNALPSLVPPYVDAAAQAAVQAQAVLLVGSSMSGPLFLNPLMPTADAQAASKAYVDTMLATAGIPEVPAIPIGQIWGRETGQWSPISQSGGNFLPITGGTMQGNINLSGNTITNMAAVPAMPNGAAPAQWVLNQIAAVSLYQGTWDADTNVPDLTQLSTHVNAYTWIAITTSVSGVVVSQPIPGLQGQTVFNGDTIIFSTAQGRFTSIHAGGLSLPEAEALFVLLAGSQMSGALLLNSNATQNMQAVTFQQLEAAVANTVTPDAPADGQGYLRVGVGTNRWVPGLPLAGGILTGALTLSGAATQPLNAVPLNQVQSLITAATTGFLPLAGGQMTGAMQLSGNATVALNPVPFQQLTTMLGAYMPTSGGIFTGPVTLPTGSTIAGYLALSGGTLTGLLTGTTLSLSGAITAPSGSSDIGGVTLNANNVTATGEVSTGNIVATIGSINSTTFGTTGAPSIDCPGNITVGGIYNGPGGTVTGTWNAGNSTIGGITLAGGNVTGAAASFSGICGAGEFSTAGQGAFASGQIVVGRGGGGAITPGADDQGFVGVGGTAFQSMAAYNFFQQSDPRLKKDTAPAPAGALEKVLAIPVINFRWLAEAESAPLHSGWDAGQVQAALGNAPAVVDQGDDNHTLALNQSEMLAWLWQAVQELAQKASIT